MEIADPFWNSKTQYRSGARSRKSQRIPITVFVHFKRGPGLALHRYRENGKRRDAPPGSSLRASNARFHYRHPTSPTSPIAHCVFRALCRCRRPCYAALHRAEICINPERILEMDFAPVLVPPFSFLSPLNAGQDSLLAVCGRDVRITLNSGYRSTRN